MLMAFFFFCISAKCRDCKALKRKCTDGQWYKKILKNNNKKNIKKNDIFHTLRH